jgi:hypothetical protein
MGPGSSIEWPAFELESGDVVGACCIAEDDDVEVDLDGDAVRDLRDDLRGWPTCARCGEPLAAW